MFTLFVGEAWFQKKNETQQFQALTCWKNVLTASGADNQEMRENVSEIVELDFRSEDR